MEFNHQNITIGSQLMDIIYHRLQGAWLSKGVDNWGSPWARFVNLVGSNNMYVGTPGLDRIGVRNLRANAIVIQKTNSRPLFFNYCGTPGLINIHPSSDGNNTGFSHLRNGILYSRH